MVDEDANAEERNTVPVEEDRGKDPGPRTGNVTDIRVSKHDLVKYGVSPGCPACQHVPGNMAIPVGMTHSQVCRAIIRTSIQEDKGVRDRIARADRRKANTGPDKIQSSLGRRKGAKMEGANHTGKLEK